MARVTLIGLGNTGSPAVANAARMPGMAALALADHDVYDESNLGGQSIDRSAIGRPKTEVQASVARLINDRLSVRCYPERIENIPIGSLRGSIVLSNVDRRSARQAINRYAFRCGSPIIDVAVDGASLVRVTTVVPGATAPCLECAWDDRAYAEMDQAYPCSGAEQGVAATAAPAELGALAAALQSAELRKLIVGNPDVRTLAGAQLMLDTESYAVHLHRIRRNDKCRFDHAVWHPATLPLSPARHTLADLFDALALESDAAIRIEGQSFVCQLNCVKCGNEKKIDLALGDRLPAAVRTCRCGGQMLSPGFFSAGSIRRSDASRENLALTLGAIGFRERDWLAVTEASGRVRHVEIGGILDNG